MYKITTKEANERLKWNLDQKIDHALGTIEQIYNKNNGNIFVAYSGGKDSCVLLNIARKFNKDIKGVFYNNGNEHTEIMKYVKKTENIVIHGVEIGMKDVIEKHGFPLISKHVSSMIERYKKEEDEEKKRDMLNRKKCKIYHIPDKYKFLINAPFDISAKCCEYLRKKPAHLFQKNNNNCGILVGTTIVESQRRFNAYLQTGCYIKEKNRAMPISIFTEKDIYECVKKFNIELVCLYKDGCNRTGCRSCGFGITNISSKLHWNYLKTHQPKQFEQAMNFKNRGVTYKEAFEYIGVKL